MKEHKVVRCNSHRNKEEEDMSIFTGAGVAIVTPFHEDGTVTSHCVRTVHAEQNAICQAAKRGISIDGGTVYCKMTPCRTCAMLLINCGIKRVVCEKHYHDEEDSLKMFKDAGIQIEHLEDSVQTYENM